jgi:hypothetical protein
VEKNDCLLRTGILAIMQKFPRRGGRALPLALSAGALIRFDPLAGRGASSAHCVEPWTMMDYGSALCACLDGLGAPYPLCGTCCARPVFGWEEKKFSPSFDH